MKKIFMLLASVALFGSCEDFLSKEDPNKIDAPSYFRNETDLQTYVNGFLQTMSPTAASVATGDAVPTAWHGAANTSSSRTTLMPTTSRAGERAIGRICATSTIFSTTSDRRPSARQRSLTTRASPVSGVPISIGTRSRLSGQCPGTIRRSIPTTTRRFTSLATVANT